MRVLVRKQVVLGKGINFETLTTWQRVRIALLSLIQRVSIVNTIYESKQQQKQIAKAREQAEKDEFLKQKILIEFDKFFGEHSEEKDVLSIVISIDAGYKDSLYRLLGLKENGVASETQSAIKAFSGYNISVVRENHDIRMAFENEMPILISCSRKYLVEVGV